MEVFRPLLDTASDQRLLVANEELLTRIDLDASRGRNTLLLGPRGYGKTTFLNAILYRAEQKGKSVTLISGAAVKDTRDFLQQLTVRFGISQPESIPDAQSIILRLTEELGHPDRHNANRLVLVDEFLSSNAWIAYELFGRLREDLWRLPISWVVTANPRDREDYLRPPADAFFSVVTTLPPLSEREAQQLLKRRYPNQFSAQARKELAGLSQGSPKRLVDLAYRVAEGESIEALKLEISENGKKFAKLLEGLDTVDCLLVQELADHGPTGPWDERLLIRFGWERSWAARRLNGLVGRGILIKSEQAHSGPGRPRTLYALADGD